MKFDHSNFISLLNFIYLDVVINLRKDQRKSVKSVSSVCDQNLNSKYRDKS
jgi:hypothetical protein